MAPKNPTALWTTHQNDLRGPAPLVKFSRSPDTPIALALTKNPLPERKTITGIAKDAVETTCTAVSNSGSYLVTAAISTADLLEKAERYGPMVLSVVPEEHRVIVVAFVERQLSTCVPDRLVQIASNHLRKIVGV